MIACAVYEYIVVRNEKRRIKEAEEARIEAERKEEEEKKKRKGLLSVTTEPVDVSKAPEENKPAEQAE